MSLGQLVILKDSYDNVPFVRTLQTTLYNIPPGEEIFQPIPNFDITPVAWFFNKERFQAKRTGNISYESGTFFPVNQITSMTFLLTTDFYDAVVEEYTTFYEEITAAYLTADPYFDFTTLLLHGDFKTTVTVQSVTVQSLGTTTVNLLPAGTENERPSFSAELPNSNNTISLFRDLDKWVITSSIEGELYGNFNENYTDIGWFPLPGTGYLDNPTITENTQVTKEQQFLDSSGFNFPVERRGNTIVSDTQYGAPPTFNSNIGAGSFRLDGSGDFLVVPNRTEHNFGSEDDFTVEGWIRFNALPVGPAALASKGTSVGSGNTLKGWTFYYEAGNLHWGSMTSNILIVSHTLQLNTWTHWAVSRHQGIVRIYVNGQFRGSTETADPSIILTDFSTTEPLVIGRSHRRTVFRGNIDEVRITKGFARYQSSTNFPLQTENYLDSGVDPNDPGGGLITTTLPLTFDNYPQILDWPELFINFEKSSENYYFYRPINTNFTFNVKLSENVAYLDRYVDVINLTTQTLTRYNTFNNITISPGSIPTNYEIRVTITAPSAEPSTGPWATPHNITNSISAFFVQYPGDASEFVAYPSRFFNSGGQQEILTPQNYFTLSPGVCFYGEGHTETINLSAKGNSNVQDFYWFVGTDIFNSYPIVNTASNGSIATVDIPSTIGFYPTIPISLLLTNQNILSDGPLFFFDDVTGQKRPYPFYYNTYDSVLQQENSLNNRLRQSIQVVSFDSILSAYSTNLSGTIFLPVDDSYEAFSARLAATLYGRKVDSLDPCYDKYDVIWRWSSFVNQLFTWDNVTSTGTNPKRWQREGIFTGNPNEIISPTFCVGSNITWVLSTPKWSIGTIIESLSGDVDINDFNILLQYYKDGSINNTVSIYENTPVFLLGEQVVTCTISAFPFDWGQKDTIIRAQTNALILSRGDTQFYLPSRYALTGENVLFRNTSLGFNNVSSIFIDFDNNKNITLTGDDIYKDISTRYPTTGPKTITVTTNYTTNSAVVDTFTNFLNVVPFFDTVNPNNYLTTKSVFSLPWPDTPFISPNEWVVEDNINSVITKFYENLEYLVKRGNSYYDTPLGFYGWLGTVPLEITKGCPIWTWEDLECLTEENNNQIIWNDVLCSPFAQGVITPDTPITVIGLVPNVNIDPLGNELTPLIDANTKLKALFPSAVTNNGVIDEYTGNLWIYTGLNWTLAIPVTGISSEFSELTAGGPLSACAAWEQHICTPEIQNPSCFGKHQLDWKWKSRKSTSFSQIITWEQTKKDGPFSKKWIYEPYVSPDGETITGIACDEGYWHVDLKKLDTYYNPIINCTSIKKCSYNSLVAYDNNIITALNTELKGLTSDYSATFVANRSFLNELYSFQNIKSLAIDKNNKVFVLDDSLNRVVCYQVDLNENNPFELIIDWGGFGTSNSQSRFSRPNEIHVDSINNVWVADTGNKCIKQYSNTGTWIMTLKDNVFNDVPPTSMCVDSSNNLHVLVKTKIRVYSYTGEFLFEYNLTPITTDEPFRIRSNYNREIIYVVYKNKVLKYFKNGMYAGIVVNEKQCATNITDVFQDDHRNVLITAGDKILKFEDPMRTRQFIAPLPSEYWSLNDLLIDKNEYVQNWVYTRAFQRLWDNIEIIRGLLVYNNEDCKFYRPCVYEKDKIFIGQNEIVTSSVINRLIAYLWTNFSSLVEYYKTGCKQTN